MSDQDHEQDETQTPAPLIDLSKQNRATVKLRDGSLREVKELRDFGAIQGQEIRRDSQEFTELWNSRDELNGDQGARLTMLVNRLFETVVDAPKTVKATVSEGDRAQIVLAFTGAPLQTLFEALQAAAQADQANQSISES